MYYLEYTCYIQYIYTHVIYKYIYTQAYIVVDSLILILCSVLQCWLLFFFSDAPIIPDLSNGSPFQLALCPCDTAHQFWLSFLAQGVPGSPCTCLALVLESVISPRSPTSFWWRLYLNRYVKLSGGENRLRKRMLGSQKPHLMDHTAGLGRIWFFTLPSLCREWESRSLNPAAGHGLRGSPAPGG